ncbi:hypothetical protein L596_015813 [Steinernema carpocapsae]|uniref:Uncharacterized protein n=1 Tax=Steinernema carpocapsae TaxID=34508 RepID=A0A4V6A3C3_STECR|nr:hypothetical protein L596_015813 [Steinernema carpocapsae]
MRPAIGVKWKAHFVNFVFVWHCEEHGGYVRHKAEAKSLCELRKAGGSGKDRVGMAESGEEPSPSRWTKNEA